MHTATLIITFALDTFIDIFFEREKETKSYLLK